MHGITQRQKDVLDYLADTIRRTGVSPSYDQIAKACGQQSKSCVSRIIESLELRGRIRRIPGKSRSIAVIDDPPA